MSSPGLPLPKAGIITRSPDGGELPRWQRELAQAFSRPADLLAFLGLEPGQGHEDATTAFSMRVPLAFARRMRHGDPADPLLRQVLPDGGELEQKPGFGTDPVGDLSAVAGPGLLRKYQGRALLLTTPACAVHCRYCFRRHFPYADLGARPDTLEAAIRLVEEDRSIREAILSGGDPLALSDDRLGVLVERLSAVPHLTTLRWHTRVPVILPSRVTPGLIATLGRSRLSQVVVLHVNHANEIDAEVTEALAALKPVTSALLNQAVLLHGINDDADTLAALMSRLFHSGVLPYYLHMLDPVKGATAFDVDEAKAGALMKALRTRLPGYLVPRLVREIEGSFYKIPVSD